MSEPARLRSFEAFDSSGVEVVVSSSASGFETPWRVSEVPFLRIGRTEGETPFLFQAIDGAVRLSDGSVVVLESASKELRRFGAEGEHLVSFGGFGQGPGEFLAVLGGIQRNGDTLLVLDSDGTVAWFRPDGSLLREVPAQGFAAGGDAMPGQWRGTLPTGQLWGSRFPQPPQHAADEFFRNPVIMVISDTDRTEVKVLGDFVAGSVSEPSGRIGYFPVLMAWPVPSRNPAGLIMADSETLTIDLFDEEGSHLRRIRYPGGVHKPERGQMQAMKDALLAHSDGATGPGGRSPDRRRWVDRMPNPPVWPAFGWVIGDEMGCIWAFEYLPTDFLQQEYLERPVTPSSALVFHEDGHLLGEVTIPAKFRPLEIGQDYLMGVEVDDWGVNEVVAYELSGRLE